MKNIIKRVLGGAMLLMAVSLLNSCQKDDEGSERFELFFPTSWVITYDEDVWKDKIYYETVSSVNYAVFPVYVGMTGGLPLGYTYSADTAINTANWVWTSSDTDVAVVDDSGRVTPLSAGRSTISIASMPTLKVVSIIVEVAEQFVKATEVTVTSPEEFILFGGKTMQLTGAVTATDPAGEQATYNTFVWTSSNPSLATVSSTGLVTSATLTGHADADVTFTATAVDGSNVSGSVTLKICSVDPGAGDVDVNVDVDLEGDFEA